MTPGNDAHGPSPAPREQRPGATTRKGQFVSLLLGAIWFALLAAIISAVTGTRFMAAFASLLALGLGCGAVSLAWMVRWAAHTETRFDRFSLGSLFFLTFYLATFSAAVRWLVITGADHLRAADPPGIRAFASVGAGLLVVVAVSVPIVWGMLDGLIWFAVDVLRWVKRRRTK
jgi:hypothetical protein